MNIVNKLTLSHLKTNKSRSVVTVLGITVSVAMITAVFVAIASFVNLFGTISRLADGDCHFQVFGLNQTQVQSLEKDDRIDAVGMSDEYYLNYSVPGQNERYTNGTITAHNEDDIKLRVQSTYEGVLPKNENEIAVERKFIEKNGLDWKVGDTVKIPYGTRYANVDGEMGDVSGTPTGKETFEQLGTKEFKVTAILNENNPISSNIITVKNDIDVDRSNGVYLRLKNPNYNSINEFKDILSDNGLNIKEVGYKTNSDLLATYFAFEKGGFVEQMLPLIVIILLIIIAASVVLIYNAFAMSLNEKIRYLGMLSSVGATKQQKRNSIFFEGFILGLLGIPLGILSGVGGIGITLKLLGDKIISTSMLNYGDKDTLHMDVVMPWWMVIAIVFISSITIIVSCAIPAVKASKITPIDAIRQSNEIKVKAKRLRSPKIIRKIFGYEGELAYKNLKRNGRKARVITASIALSVILFLSSSYFCSLFVQSANIERAYPYQISVFTEFDSRDSVLEKIKENADVDDVYSTSNEYHQIEKLGTDTDFEEIRNEEFLTSSYKDLFSKMIPTVIYYIDDDLFNELCTANGIDYKDYYTDDIKAVLMNDLSRSNSYNPVFNDKIIGTKIKSSYDRDVTIAGMVKYDKNFGSCNCISNGYLGMFAPFSSLEKMMSDVDDDLIASKRVSYGIETDNHEKVYEDLSSEFDDAKYSKTMVSDIQQTFQTMDTVVLIIQVFIYGFISLISLITVFNIINTISTGIVSRRKEFAMLQSVGITPKGFNKMLTLESAFYGLKALLFSLPISALISYGMNAAVGEASIPFFFDYKMYLAVTAVVMIVIGMTMLYSIKKVQKQNIIETLKDDIV
ncbi:ABC transporter permease [Eubacterium sp.]|uniref:ABC transporter permease n=1 Tax=Eubacterium sp. TaxID=142586 RepID=UPI004026F21A